jgi:hypothetical protein
MKEYEYICAGIEHFLVDELVAVICQENLDGKTYEHGFRKLFDNYKKLRRSFIELSYDGREIDSGDISNELAKKRNDVLNSFIDDIDANYPSLNVRYLVEQYQTTIDSQDTINTEKRVSIFPYIISQIRILEEEKNNNGN